MALFGLTCRALVALLIVSVTCAAHVTPPQKVVFKVANLENGKPAEFIVEVHSDWAPAAAKRFMDLVKQNHFDGSRFHHVLSGYAAKFGISGDPTVTSAMLDTKLEDEPLIQHNARGKLAFVPDGSQPTQIIISAKTNENLDRQGYVPFASVSGGIGAVDRLYSQYGATEAPKGRAPSIDRIEKEGNPYLTKDFPKLSYITETIIMEQTIPQEHVTATSSHKFFLAFFAFVMAMIVGGGWHLWGATVVGAKQESF